MNRALSLLHGGLLEITLTFPLGWVEHNVRSFSNSVTARMVRLKLIKRVYKSLTVFQVQTLNTISKYKLGVHFNSDFYTKPQFIYVWLKFLDVPIFSHFLIYVANFLYILCGKICIYIMWQNAFLMNHLKSNKNVSKRSSRVVLSLIKE